MIEVSGAVDVEYSMFYVGEAIEPGDERHPQPPLPSPESPVTAGPGLIYVGSRVQEHEAPVALVLTEEPEPAQGKWRLLTALTYTPCSGGRMWAYGLTAGPATPDQGEYGRVHLHLDPDTAYTVHVYAAGREDSAERYDAAMEREEWGTGECFEEYRFVFTPA